MTLPLQSMFWAAIAFVIVGQVMILRSTVRVIRASAPGGARRSIEWAYAIVPAIVLAVVLLATGQSVRGHETRLELEARATQSGPP